MGNQRQPDHAHPQDYSKASLQTHTQAGLHNPDARPGISLHTTLKLEVSVALSSILSIALMCLAGVQSQKHFITLGLAPLVIDNTELRLPTQSLPSTVPLLARVRDLLSPKVSS